MRGTVAKLITKHEQKANVALQNEQVTRARVDRIEELLSRKLLGRLKWMILGR